MRKFTIAAVAVLAIAGSTAVYAQHRHWGFGHMRMNPEDRAAFADARIAAVHAGLKLTPDQEKLWPPVEADAEATMEAGALVGAWLAGACEAGAAVAAWDAGAWDEGALVAA